jgi:tRNA threonylcarbamoyladenosine biosynthesis protein TsaE
VQRWQTQTTSPDQTRTLGRTLGALIEGGLVVLLNGDLGAGKTCFAQGLARGLGVPEDEPVTSPSYALLNIHQGRIPLYHFDLYRLTRVDDLADLGYDEIAGYHGLTLVEWSDRMSGGLEASLAVSISRLAEQHREVCFEALDARGCDLLAGLVERHAVNREKL